MKFLKVILRPCDKLPPDVKAIVGFKIRGDKIFYLLHTHRGVEVMAARCEECVFYRLLAAGYVLRGPILENQRIKVIVSDNAAVRKILSKDQVVEIKTLDSRELFLTPRQREVLQSMANGGNLATLAERYQISKTAVYKTFKNVLKKITALV
ncbi:MAG: LuxR C-terminal-related transcriptional regulator [Pyrobaculum sp.]